LPWRAAGAETVISRAPVVLALAFGYFRRRYGDDEDNFNELLRINDELIELCKWINKKRDWKFLLA
jgi:hypothetical protein